MPVWPFCVPRAATAVRVIRDAPGKSDQSFSPKRMRSRIFVVFASYGVRILLPLPLPAPRLTAVLTGQGVNWSVEGTTALQPFSELRLQPVPANSINTRRWAVAVRSSTSSASVHGGDRPRSKPGQSITPPISTGSARWVRKCLAPQVLTAELCLLGWYLPPSPPAHRRRRGLCADHLQRLQVRSSVETCG